jgi:hypothetical protein
LAEFLDDRLPGRPNHSWLPPISRRIGFALGAAMEVSLDDAAYITSISSSSNYVRFQDLARAFADA